jgi:hypothetical protein
MCTETVCRAQQESEDSPHTLTLARDREEAVVRADHRKHIRRMIDGFVRIALATVSHASRAPRPEWKVRDVVGLHHLSRRTCNHGERTGNNIFLKICTLTLKLSIFFGCCFSYCPGCWPLVPKMVFTERGEGEGRRFLPCLQRTCNEFLSARRKRRRCCVGLCRRPYALSGSRPKPGRCEPGAPALMT